MEHKLNIFVFSFMSNIIYAFMNRQGDIALNIIDIFNVIRSDTKDAVTEIWLALNKVLMLLYNTVAVTKLIELILIGFFIITVPNLYNFVLKSLNKLGKL